MDISSLVEEYGTPSNIYLGVGSDADPVLVSWNRQTPNGNKATTGAGGTISKEVTVDGGGEIISLAPGSGPLRLTIFDPQKPKKVLFVANLQSVGDAVHVPGGVQMRINSLGEFRYICEYPGVKLVDQQSPIVEHSSGFANVLKPGQVSVKTESVAIGNETAYLLSASPSSQYKENERALISVYPNKQTEVAQLTDGNHLTLKHISGSGEVYVFDPITEKLTQTPITDSKVIEIKVGQIYCIVASSEGLIISDTCLDFNPRYECTVPDFNLAGLEGLNLS